MSIKNDSLIKALLRQPVARTPVWLMRQAGRYLPEYQKLRQQAGSFMALCQNPEWACEVTLQPLNRFDLDAAILFSDILTIPHAMDVGLHFSEGLGPIINHPIRTMADVKGLKVLDPYQDLKYVLDAVTCIKASLSDSLPLIGFAGSPWTLATYMIEGGSSKAFAKIRTLLYQAPEILLALLEKLTQATIDYLQAQIHSGVDVIMLFDTWGGILPTLLYQKYSLEPMKKIFQNLPLHYQDRRIPRIMFTKGGGAWLEEMAKIDVDALGLDWTTDLGVARKRVGNLVSLQGNMDPFVLQAEDAFIKTEAERILSSYGHGSGHVFNLGHGVDKTTHFDKVALLVDTVHRLSEPYHHKEPV